MKILNLYAGIGGNRKLWNEIDDNLKVIAVEIDEKIARVYQDNFLQDEIIIGDAHEFLENNYEEWDFIWSSPPCPTHSKIRNIAGVGRGQNKPVYPDMELYEEIIFLKQITNSNGVNFNGKWCVENVKSYYNPLIKPQARERHYFWSNFFIPDFNRKKQEITGDRGRESVRKLQKYHGFDLSDYNFGIKEKVKLLRNCVHPKLGRHILESAFKNRTKKLGDFINV